MEIAAADNGPAKQSNLASATYTAIALLFFFGIGLAGGAAYKLYFEDGQPLVADRGAAASARPQGLAAPAASSPVEDAPDLARAEASTPPAIVPSLPPISAPAAKPQPSPADAQPVSLASEPATQAAPAEPPPAPPVALAPAEPATPTKVAAIPPKKPTPVAKIRDVAQPQTVASHPAPTPRGNAAGPFRLQFGAFADEDNARRVQWAVEATGLKVDVTRAPVASGKSLFFVRSPDYQDYAGALSAALTVQHRVEHFVNAIPIEYAILPDRGALEQQAQR